MMNYEMFKEMLQMKIKEYMPEEIKHWEIEFRKVEKVNHIRDGITFINPDEDKNVAPTIYVDDLYARYEHYGNFYEAVAPIIQTVKELDNEGKKIWESADLTNVKNRIVGQLINTNQNKEMLETMPHREFADLSLVYRWIVGGTEEKPFAATSVINDVLAYKMGLNENELFQCAMQNMKEQYPTVIRPMRDVMAELLGAENRDLLEEEMEDSMMYVVTNKAKCFGAVGMLDEEQLHKFASELDSNIYLLPSSIHELIAIRTEGFSVQQLTEMVYDINMTQVDMEERLSNEIYHYDKDKREVSRVSQSPHHSLDNQTADQERTIEIIISGR